MKVCEVCCVALLQALTRVHSASEHDLHTSWTSPSSRRWKPADSSLWGNTPALRHHQRERLLLLFADSEMWLNQQWVTAVNSSTQTHKPSAAAHAQKCAAAEREPWDHRGRSLSHGPAGGVQENSEIRWVAACCVSWKLKVRAVQIKQECLHNSEFYQVEDQSDESFLNHQLLLFKLPLCLRNVDRSGIQRPSVRKTNRVRVKVGPSSDRNRLFQRLHGTCRGMWTYKRPQSWLQRSRWWFCGFIGHWTGHGFMLSERQLDPKVAYGIPLIQSDNYQSLRATCQWVAGVVGVTLQLAGVT